MFIETVKLQARLAFELHREGCGAAPGGHYPLRLDLCPSRDMYIRKGGVMLARLMPTIITEVVPAVRADEREKVAYRIEAELVCCDLYDRINTADLDALGLTMKQWSTLGAPAMATRLGLDFHDICHWGGYAASIARAGDGPGHWAPEAPEPAPVDDRWQTVVDEVTRLSELHGVG